MRQQIHLEGSSAAAQQCRAVREEFSAYLDGAVSGLEMAFIVQHLEACEPCAAEFAAWRTVQQALGQMGPAHPPANMQASLRAAIAQERARGTHLSLLPRLAQAWAWIYSRGFAWKGSNVWTSLAFALCFVAVCFLPNWWLWNRKWFWKM